MRLVVDTNVFVSAALKENSLPFLVARWIDRHDGLLKSAATERQLLEVLSRSYIAAATIPSLREGVARMLAAAELVAIAERIAACRDPTDDKFLELGAGGQRPCRSDRHWRPQHGTLCRMITVLGGIRCDPLTLIHNRFLPLRGSAENTRSL
jgi:uncharacterized protein